MSEKLGVSPAFLSKVENGKAKPPAEWRQKLIFWYELDENAIEELDIALFEANNTKSIDITGFSDDDKALMWSFARKLDRLDRSKLREFLDEEE
jgi:transcriptional regulator with XRE-family HTH domain